MNVIRVLLADDHNLFRHGLRRILEGQEGFEIIAEASTGYQLRTKPHMGAVLRKMVKTFGLGEMAKSQFRSQLAREDNPDNPRREIRVDYADSYLWQFEQPAPQSPDVFIKMEED